MVDKLIVTNRAALRAKYGARGLARLTAAINTLIAADRKRGLMTRLIALDSAAMKRYGPTVTDASSARQNKRAIDFREFDRDCDTGRARTQDYVLNSQPNAGRASTSS